MGLPPRPEKSTILLAGSLLVGAASALTFVFLPPSVVRTGDERDYLRAAIHLARSGVHSSEPADRPPRPDAYREPGYPALLATAWRLSGTEPPSDEEQFLAEPNRAAKVARAVGAGLLALSAGAAAAAARRAGGSAAVACAAGALVMASPALRQAASTPGSEGLAAALVAIVAFGWVTSSHRASALASALTGCIAGLAALARGASIALIPLGVALELIFPRRESLRRRAVCAALFAGCALIPVGAWMSRNFRATGHFVLSDRGGQVMWTRAELDHQVAKEGVAPAVAAWTPIEIVRRGGRRLFPEATFERYEWQGEGNFFTRSLRSWHAERRASDDPIAVDLSFGRRAFASFARAPIAHLETTGATCWRGLFAERSPTAIVPLDLTFVFALLLATCFTSLTWRALRTRSAALAALVAGPWVLFCFHAGATEFLARFSVAALPITWAAVAFRLGGVGDPIAANLIPRASRVLSARDPRPSG